MRRRLAGAPAYGGFMHRSAAEIVMLAALVAGLPHGAAAQRRKPAVAGGGPAEQTSVTIDAKVGGKRYKANGSGECKHAPDASIRGMSAALWMVRYTRAKDGPLKQLNLTLWRPKDGGGDQLSLSVETKSGSHRIEMGGSGENVGEGSVTILPSGPGGRLEISGKEAGGKPVQITIDCPEFAGVEAEGG
jgi:hypothetical protein